MTKKYQTIVIGAGQAGLAIGYYLAQQNQNYLILEKASEIVPAWRSRWDSFTLVLPNWTLKMPNFAYHGADPDGFMTREEVVDYMERFAATFDCNVRLNCEVTSLEKSPGNDHFLVRTRDTVYETDNVVVTAGTYQAPKIPTFRKKLNPEITQLHTSAYRNPDELPPGAVLVVGTGQSGSQIAEELYQSGRKVYLCVGGAMRLPRVYRGKDSVWWLGKMNFFDQNVKTLKSPQERFTANPFFSGKDGGHDLNLHQFARDGVVLLGRLKDADDHTIFLASDLKENLTKVDRFLAEVTKKIDGFIEANQIDAEPAANQAPLTDGYKADVIQELDLEAAGIHTIIWATGYRFDFRWIHFPVLDEAGYPLQDRGVSEVPGLYFLGLHWLFKRRSGLPWGVGEDAAHVAKEIEKRSQAVPDEVQ